MLKLSLITTLLCAIILVGSTTDAFLASPNKNNVVHKLSNSCLNSSKWSGQNSYTQQLLQQQPPPAATVGVDAYAADMDIESRSSFVQEQQEKEQSTEASVVVVDNEFDPYEMQNLQDEMEIDIQVNEGESGVSSSVVVSSSSVSNGVEYIQVNEEEFTTAVSSNSSAEQQLQSQSQSNKSTVLTSASGKKIDIKEGTPLKAACAKLGVKPKYSCQR